MEYVIYLSKTHNFCHLIHYVEDTSFFVSENNIVETGITVNNVLAAEKAVG